MGSGKNGCCSERVVNVDDGFLVFISTGTMSSYLYLSKPSPCKKALYPKNAGGMNEQIEQLTTHTALFELFVRTAHTHISGGC